MTSINGYYSPPLSPEFKKRGNEENQTTNELSPPKVKKTEPTGLTPILDNGLRLSRTPSSRVAKRLTFSSPEEQRPSLSSTYSRDPFFHCVPSIRKELDQAYHSEAEPDQWLNNYPKSAGDKGVSGTYFFKNTVIKPFNQEPGLDDNPSKSTQPRAGITPGYSAVRSWLPSFFQDYLNFDFGVPFGGLTELKHPRFGNANQCPIRFAISKLNKPNIKDENDVKPLLQGCSTYDQFYDKIIEAPLENILSQLDKRGILDNQENKLALFQMIDESETLLVLKQKFVFNQLADLWKENHFLFSKLWEHCKYTEKVKNDLLLIWSVITTTPANCSETLVSIHEFLPNCQEICELEPEKFESIEISEFQKLIIELIFLNTDLSEPNILYQNGQIRLIDFDLCLPDPKFSNHLEGLKDTEFEIWEYEQIDQPITGSLKEKILSFNVDQFIKDLRQELLIQQTLQPKFSRYIDMPEDCFTLLKFNLLMVQKGISMNKTIRDMAAIFCDVSYPYGGEICHLLASPEEEDSVLIFENNKFEIDQMKLNEQLEQIFSRPIKERRIKIGPLTKIQHFQYPEL